MKQVRVWPNRCLAAVILIGLIIPAVTAGAQTGSRFTWDAYAFSLTLPDGWTTAASDERLILGLPGDVTAAEAGDMPAGLVVEVWIVESAPLDYDYLPLETDEWATYPFGTVSYPVLPLPSTPTRQGWLVLVEASYLLVVSAPLDTDFPPIVTDLIASIEATPLPASPVARLTNTLAWHDLSLTVPGDWVVLNTGAGLNMVMFNSYYNHLNFMQTFSLERLLIIASDYRQFAHFYAPEDLFDLEAYIYKPGRVQRGEITSYTHPGYRGYAADFADLEAGITGRVVVIRAPGKLYMLVGMAGSAAWTATEQQLFDAILATLALTQ